MGKKLEFQHKKEWFGEWFNSPYYHILYKHRDDTEAAAFIDKLSNYFQFKPSQKILDLACGRGRHAIYLNQKGLDILGVDLSAENIGVASKSANERLQFIQRDMRHINMPNQFDVVLNLFTSFGYFDDPADNQKVICEIAESLKPDGIFIIDFLNPHWVQRSLITEEVKLVQGIEFHIFRRIEKGFILKDIKFNAAGIDYAFQEKVKSISHIEFEAYFEKAKLNIIDLYGDYELGPYHEDESHRMIFVVKK